MYYCNNCADENNWPKTFGGSFRRCEECGENEICNALAKDPRTIKNQPKGSIELTELQIAKKRIDELEKGMLHLSNLANTYVYNSNDGIAQALLKTAIHKYELLAKNGKVAES